MTIAHPIDNVQWVDVDLLDANDYNPNVVIGPELKLIKLSLLSQGWIQPVLVAREEIPGAFEDVKGGDEPSQPKTRLVIIDGFHRSSLTKVDPELRALTGGKVPCAVLDLSIPERMLLTVRINRAKGSHVAVKMHDLVSRLVSEHGLPKEEIAKKIGATVAEVELLLTENVFKKLDIENHEFSKAWTIKGAAGV